MYFFSASSEAVLKSVKPQLQALAHEALRISPIDFGYPRTGGLRTAVEQTILFHEGKSNADGLEHISKHQKGEALDFYAFVDGKASWDKHHLAIVAAAHLQAASKLGVAIEWGGLWRSFEDYPHIELAD